MDTRSEFVLKTKLQFLLAALTFLAVVQLATGQTFTLATEVKQPITGWGCFPGWVDWGYRIATNQALQDAVYRDLGMTVARVPIMPGYGNPDGSLNTEAIDHGLALQLATLRKYHLKQWIVTTWSPPVFMKTVASTKGYASNQPTHLKPEFEDAFVNYYVQVLVYLREVKKLGTPLYATIQNEPDYAASWDGCVYEPAQWRRLTKKLRQALDEHQLASVKIHGPDHNHYTLSKFLGPDLSEVASDPELFRAMDGIAFHSYGEGKESGAAAAAAARTLILRFKELKPGSEIWETEDCTDIADEDLTTAAIRQVRSMMRDIGYLQANCYFYWLGASERNKYAGEDLILNGNKTKLYFVFQKLWHSVPPGEFFVKTFSGDGGSRLSSFGPDPMDLLAFVSKKSTVIVLTNPAAEGTKINLAGLAGSRMAIFRTSASEDMAAVGSQPIIDGKSEVSLSGRSIYILETNGGPLKRTES